MRTDKYSNVKLIALGTLLNICALDIDTVAHATGTTQTPVADPLGLPIHAIAFVGNHGVSTNELLSALPIKPGGRLPVSVLQEEVYPTFVEQAFRAPLAATYLERGYAEHQLDVDDIEITREGDGVAIQITVHEGPTYTVGKVELVGVPAVEQARMLRVLGVKPDERFNQAKLSEGTLRLVNQLRDGGHAAAEITPTFALDAEHKTVAIRLAVNLGTVYFVERIEVEGNEHVTANVIRRVLAFQVGDRFSQAAMERSHRELMANGYFDEIKLALTPGSKGDALVVTVQATERPQCRDTEAL